MLIFDQLKKDDPQLRFLALVVAGGLLILFAGLWWVQVVSAAYYQDKLETQSIRTVRIPAVRGNILDRDGRTLAENRPSFNVGLYLEDLSKKYQAAYKAAEANAKTNLALWKAYEERKLTHKLSKQEQKEFNKRFAMTWAMRAELQQRTRYQVSSNIVAELSARLGQPIPFEPKDFQRQYDKARALPMPILANLNPTNVARFLEQSMHTPGMDLDVQSTRYYPHGALAGHLLGYLGRSQDSRFGELSDYDYRLDDYIGKTGIEKLFDQELSGTAGAKSVLVNNLGYRQHETILSAAEPGHNVVLTIDLDIQRAAEAALQEAQANVRGAVVVMDPNSGDILAMASAPTYNPNHFVRRPDPEPWDNERWMDPEVGLQRNRAMQENYHPGSIFKPVVALAALELGVLDPNATFHSEGFWRVPGRAKTIGDTAGPGDFDFNRAMAKSSNPYFINNGVKPGVLAKIVELGERLHFGERTGLIPGQEARGNFPTRKRIAAGWHYGDTCNLSIGQGEIDVTPVQVAVMVSAFANGGKVLQPRIVSQLENFEDGSVVERFPAGVVRDNLGVSARSLRILRDGMLADTESDDGTGRTLNIPGWRVAGKTGTAEVERNGVKDKSAKNTWFVSYAPVEQPRYVVVATVEGGLSGGRTCVPIAQKVYTALKERELQRQQQKSAPKPGTLAQAR